MRNSNVRFNALTNFDLSSAAAETRDLLLDAAEKLFAAHGVEGASVRDITKAAGSNLSAVNYHFGSKNELVAEVFTRRMEPLNRARIAALDAVEARAGDRALRLEEVMEAFIRPVIEGDEMLARQSQAFIRLMCRAFQEPAPELAALVRKCFNELVARFDAAIHRAEPGLPANETFWAMSFVIGALHHSLDVWSRFEWIPKAELYDVRPPLKLTSEELLRRLVSFTTAGIRAQVTAERRNEG